MYQQLLPETTPTLKVHSGPLPEGPIPLFEQAGKNSGGNGAAAVAWQNGAVVSQSTLFFHVSALLEQLPEQGYVIIDCQDRYHFLVCFLAALVKKQIILFPPNLSQHVLQELSREYAGVYCLSVSVGPLLQTLPDNDSHDNDSHDNDSQVDLSHGAQSGSLPDLDIVKLNLTGVTPKRVLEADDFRIESDRIIGIAFTSGSTGKPNPISKTWGGLWHEALITGLALGYEFEVPRGILATVPPNHMYGFLHSIVLPLRFGYMVHAAQPFYSAELRQVLRECPLPSVLVTTPMQLRQCVSEQTNLPGLSSIVSSAAALDRQIAAEAEALYGVPVLETYGSTESGGIAVRCRTATDCWQPFPGITLVGQHNQFQVSAAHLPGEITIGDRIETLADGQFYLLGRNADLVKIGGKRASLADLNQHLLQISAVEDGVIFLPDDRPSTLGESRLAALVVAPGYSKESLLTELRQRIDPVFLPKQLRFVTQLPRTVTGKLPRQQLLDCLLDKSSSEFGDGVVA